MAIDVLMPKLSDTMEEGKILKWLKQPGERVRQGDLLAEVETDKANMEIEAFDDGVLSELKVAEGASAPVGAVIAVLSDAAGAGAGRPEPKPAARAESAPAGPAPKRAPAAPETSAAAKPAVPKVVAAAKPARAAEPSAREVPAALARAPVAAATAVKASPLARKIAADRGIDLARIEGTGPGGRIVQQDVERAAGSAGSAPEAPPAARAPAPRAEPAAARATPPPSDEDRRVEPSRMRRTTARRMAEAKRDVPHFYASADLDVGEAIRLRHGLVAVGGLFEGLTITHLLLRACGLALRRVPEMNASLDGEAIVQRARVHIGLATATDDGLIVPVVRDCDTAPLATIVAEARAVVERARAGKPTGEDLTGATFTISNLGMFPVAHFAAVVNPPQAAILAVGTVRDVPVVRDGAVVPGHLMTVTLSCDHRVVDGVLAGRFLAELKALVEQPLALVV